MSVWKELSLGELALIIAMLLIGVLSLVQRLYPGLF
jgi:hypothetical protein